MSHSEQPQIVLASASPRRRELLCQIGVEFRVVAADIEEIPLQHEKPTDFVLRMAREKALAVMRAEGNELPVLGSDTAVILDGRILGKPADRRQAREMLGGLSGRTHQVFSAVVVAESAEKIHQALNISKVTFAALDPEWIESYIDTGDPMDKAGAYGVQGKAAEKISRIEGSFYGVMGLPLYETAQLLQRAQVLF
ncbi:MAG: septum formation inhibitor Maf [Xanthomonadales bacterium]|nr:septum formation inhibitor Maf [Gammaproteobacteria bacterium]MBT8054494.1 septum formation inhibitor Maf [Gammaproteobacteria bacterium]NND57709.1 septum formation inhibitor Maf [Xanthomonadales bacterium]NNK52620.1 septum formation inhibitor Maf [Xanthomonadales bacterium]